MVVKGVKFAGLVVGLALCATSVWAADYSGYSTDELAAMRGSMREVSDEDRGRFRAEWKKRVNELPVEERAKYTTRPENAEGGGQGQGKGGKSNRSETRKHDGSGQNGGYGGGGGQGGGHGHGGGGRR